jgi:hypothetical protein
MSAGIAGITGFIGGFADGRNERKARDERAADAARQDRYIAAMNSSQPGGPQSEPLGLGGGGGGGGMPGARQSGGDGSLFGLIDATEGGGNYSTLFGHSQNGGKFDGVDVTKMSLAELNDFSAPSGEYGQWVKGQVGRVATPMGRHQIVGTTLRSASDAMGLSGDTLFTPGIQDNIANYLARQRLSGAPSPAAKRAQLRAEWEGFKNVSDAALDAAIYDFELTGGMPPRPMGAGPA